MIDEFFLLTLQAQLAQQAEYLEREASILGGTAKKAASITLGAISDALGKTITICERVRAEQS
jgi:hypothetical protein